jgi:hypothetical protein
MKQHPIDLLPESVRARSRAGQRTSRFIIAAAIAIGLLTIAATHSSFVLISAQDELFAASTRAEPVFTTEARASELKALLTRTNEFINLYDRLALPITVSSVIATVVNNLPDSVTLDQFDLDAGGRAPGRTSRGKGTDTRSEPVRRVLTAEVSGFAATDQQIAELVGRLDATPPFREVNLDFSRTRDINGRDAREFRLSFKIDLDVGYDVSFSDHASGTSSSKLSPTPPVEASNSKSTVSVLSPTDQEHGHVND